MHCVLPNLYWVSSFRAGRSTSETGRPPVHMEDLGWPNPIERCVIVGIMHAWCSGRWNLSSSGSKTGRRNMSCRLSPHFIRAFLVAAALSTSANHGSSWILGSASTPRSRSPFWDTSSLLRKWTGLDQDTLAAEHNLHLLKLCAAEHTTTYWAYFVLVHQLRKNNYWLALLILLSLSLSRAPTSTDNNACLSAGSNLWRFHFSRSHLLNSELRWSSYCFSFSSSPCVPLYNLGKAMFTNIAVL